MKVEVNNQEEKQEEIKYPYLGIADDGDIVLFIGENTGPLLRSKTDFGTICMYSNLWNMKNFKPFKGSITLSND